MAEGELKVDPNDLTTKAATVEGIPWGGDPSAVQLSDPDTLSATTASVGNLVKNAAALGAEQRWGQAESRRLAETLRLVAKAYQDVDEASRNNIDASIPGGASAPAPAPVPIGQNVTPPPPVPPAMAPFADVSDNDGVLDPIETDEKLAEGDHGATLRAAAAEWTANAARLTEAAIPFEVRMQNWEGVAAEAAYSKLKSFGGWLQALAGKWIQLAAEAEKLATAHDQAKAANAPIRAEFEALRTAMLQGGGLTASQASQTRIWQLIQDSEAIREAYANAGRPTPVQPPQPRPNSVAPNSPVTTNGDPRARGVRARTEDEERRDPLGAGERPSSSGASAQPGGESQPPQAPQEMPASPMGGEQAPQAEQGGQPGGAPGGGQQGGGQQGGSPGGGSPGGTSGGGIPTTGKGIEPRLPSDPSLKPAAAGGGSSGVGGGGGGGVPASPLQPAVGAETVAPTPVVPGAPVPVASAGSGGAGAMGGGVGGMAPMHGGYGGGAGEKKRNPQLSVDEPLYVEDRPHTEQVIGVRPRRRGTPEDGKRGETS